MLLLLLVRPERDQRWPDERNPDATDHGDAGVRHLLVEDELLKDAQAGAAVLLGPVGGDPTALGEGCRPRDSCVAAFGAPADAAAAALPTVTVAERSSMRTWAASYATARGGAARAWLLSLAAVARKRAARLEDAMKAASRREFRIAIGAAAVGGGVARPRNHALARPPSIRRSGSRRVRRSSAK